MSPEEMKKKIAEAEISNVEFVTDQEPFSRYMLEDGNIVILKNVLTDVELVEGCYNPDGSPVYNVHAQTITRVIKGKNSTRWQKPVQS